jgi:hypothetical protein
MAARINAQNLTTEQRKAWGVKLHRFFGGKILATVTLRG